MEHLGRLTSWDDARGFGFITSTVPQHENQRVFVHISAFPPGRRPLGEELLRYTVETDERGRLRAPQVEFVVAEPERGVFRWTPQTGLALCLAGLFLLGLLAASLGNKLPFVVPGAYLALSVLLFGKYYQDKKAAQESRWRTPESQLHLLSALGGWPGALVAQQGLRHKTRKASFLVTFGATVGLNLLLLGIFGWLFSAQSP